MDLVERGAQALYDLREHQGIRPPVSTWPPLDHDEADDYRLEAGAVIAAVNAQGFLRTLREIAAWVEIESKDGGTRQVPMDGYAASMKARLALRQIGEVAA